MSHPGTAREALFVETLGELAALIERVEALTPAVTSACDALVQAQTGLRAELAGVEPRFATLAESAKAQTIKHIAARTDEAARRSIELQSRAMADAARVAFGAELGATVQRLHTLMQPLIEAHRRRGLGWLTHAVVAAAAATITVAAFLFSAGCRP
jgi:hypothetical protein